MNKVISDEMCVEMKAYYDAGQTIRRVAERFNISAGKVFYILRDNGCSFRKRGYNQPPMTQERRERIGAAHRGKHVSAETKRRISESRRSKYNGLNGYGHTKNHISGYRIAFAPEHPHASKDGYVMEHTIIMERAIGRYLYDNEEVHHINRCKNDNRIENLLIMDKHEHHRMHMKERWAQKKGERTYQ